MQVSCCAGSLMSTSGQGPRERLAWVAEWRWVVDNQLHPHESWGLKSLHVEVKCDTQMTNITMLIKIMIVQQPIWHLSFTTQNSTNTTSVHVQSGRQWATSGASQWQRSGREPVTARSQQIQQSIRQKWRYPQRCQLLQLAYGTPRVQQSWRIGYPQHFPQAWGLVPS